MQTKRVDNKEMCVVCSNKYSKDGETIMVEAWDGGFVCDHCRFFTTFEGVMAAPDGIDFDLDVPEEEEEEVLVKSNLAFVKSKDWGYYNVIPLTFMASDDWIKWTKKSKCYCPRCNRLIKLNKLISKLKRHD